MGVGIVVVVCGKIYDKFCGKIYDKVYGKICGGKSPGFLIVEQGGQWPPQF